MTIRGFTLFKRFRRYGIDVQLGWFDQYGWTFMFHIWRFDKKR